MKSHVDQCVEYVTICVKMILTICNARGGGTVAELCLESLGKET